MDGWEAEYSASNTNAGNKPNTIARFSRLHCWPFLMSFQLLIVLYLWTCITPYTPKMQLLCYFNYDLLFLSSDSATCHLCYTGKLM